MKMGIEEMKQKQILLSFYRNKIVVQKGKVDRKESLNIDEEILKAEKLNHLSKRIKLIEYAMEKYK